MSDGTQSAQVAQPIAVSTEELLMLLGRLYLENYTLQRRIAALTPPPAPPTEPPPTET